MIITKTPFRISFFGGGSDLPCWYKENCGAVLSTTIDKYCYITCRSLPQFFDYKHRIVYSKIELINDINDIKHPSVKETFKFMRINNGIELHHDGDLPARTGLGSSSAFTVGLLNALYGLQGKIISKMKLALDAIHVEQELIKENVGSQDQVAAAFGGFNKITFSGNHLIDVKPVTISLKKINNLQNHLMLFFTGFTRFADEIEKDKINSITQKTKEYSELCGMVEESIKILNQDIEHLHDFGKLLNESWKLKKSLSDKVSTTFIDNIYEKGMKNGALGGKILGAGGGGFILFFVPEENRNRIMEALKDLLYIPFNFESMGSQIIYYKGSEIEI
ncbi:kinase [Candidatus Dependentiae bacterium]|nr:kinase [Candidatus Dependentiae bacterium]